MKWRVLHELVEREQLLEIERLFIEKQPSLSEEKALFLAAILAFSRLQFMSVCVENGQFYPDLSLWLSDKASEIAGKIYKGAQECMIDPPSCIVRRGAHFFLQKQGYLAEQIRAHFQRLAAQPAKEAENFLPDPLLSQEQNQALENSFRHPFSLIVGGPGTGKSFVAAKIARAFIKKGAKVALAAPTAKAAEHLRAKLHIDGANARFGTLHAILHLGAHFSLRAPFFLEADLVIVDEASMIDPALMFALLSSIRGSTHLVLMGDPDQLPPIEGPSSFAAFIQFHLKTNQCTLQRLTRSFRAEASEIEKLVEALASKDIKEVKKLLKKAESVSWLNLQLENGSHKLFYDNLFNHLYSRWKVEIQTLDDTKIFHHFERFRVLTPFRRGPFGTEMINKEMEKRFRLSGASAFPIMILQNDSNSGLFNGQVGVLVTGQKEEYALFTKEGSLIKLSRAELPYHCVAYALSVHKSQGSEYATICLLVPPGSENFGREMVYTALTRAKKKVEIEGSEQTLIDLLTRSSQKEERWFHDN